MTVGVTFSSLTRFVGCSSGVGDAPTRFDCGELARCAARFVFFSVGLGVGCGWKAFETDWPTFLKKSPTGSAVTQRPLKKNSAATGSEIQRERKKRLIRFSAFNVKTRFSVGSGSKRRKNFSARELLASLSKRIMQPEQLRCIAKRHGKDFGVIVPGNGDRRCDPQRLEQVRDRAVVSDDERVAGQCTQFLGKCANIICRKHCGTDVRLSRCRCRSFLRALEFGNEHGRNL